jgi:DNA-binding NtrC family response regulator
VLVVDDEPSLRVTLSVLLRREGFQVTAVDGAAAARQALEREMYDVVITDLRLQDGDGREVVQTARRLYPDTGVIVLTAYGSIGSAVEMIKLGALDYLTKPVDPEELLLAVRKTLERQALRREVEFLRAQIRQQFGLDRIIATSPRMRALLELVCRVAPSDATVLIQGESGTGKEVIARALHARSSRAGRPLVVVDCATLPDALLESELFGHVRGAFTGAVTAKKGLLEEAHQGTVFLDELGALPPGTQVKLLRCLQERTIRRVGSTTPITVDVRVVAATNQDLKALVERGRFREDLYYRLQGIVLTVPPLRERIEDIVPLAVHFVKLFADKLGRPTPTLSAEVVDRLLRYPWPGNVRELEKAMERAVVLARGDTIQLEDLPPAVAGTPDRAPVPARRWQTLEEVEKAHILATLYEAGWNQARAAELLGISRTTLWRKLREYGVQPP